MINIKKLIEIPDDIFNVLEQHKNMTGRSIMSMIQESIYRWMVHEKLIKIKTVTIKREKEPEAKEKQNVLPEEIKFCDGGESCEINFNNNQK